MPPSKITNSTPGEINQTNLIPDLIEEQYFEFASMCGFGLNAY